MTKKIISSTGKLNNFLDNVPSEVVNDPILKSRHNSRMNRLRRRRRNIVKPHLKPRVFLSHAWKKDSLGRDTHELVKKLNKKLIDSNKVFTWLDEEQLSGHLIQSITKGIDKCDVIIICITRAYIDKCANETNDNCKIN